LPRCLAELVRGKSNLALLGWLGLGSSPIGHDCNGCRYCFPQQQAYEICLQRCRATGVVSCQ
jgi:hypothetical protein